ncbi:MAG: 3-phosphoshikimate 1-carboxyvinyltransferase [Armatimonadota bacterium]
MNLSIEKSNLSGRVRIPASKSHTVRAVAIGSLAEGTSRVTNPLVSADALSAVRAYHGLGAEIETGEVWAITGGKPQVPENVLDVGNSGTTLYIAMGSAALADGWSIFTGDEQIRARPAEPLMEALAGLGAQTFSTRGNGRPPLAVRGPMRGGKITLNGSKTSQYLTSLLVNCPLAEGDTEIEVRNAVEKPYTEMTLAWLAEQGIRFERYGFERFVVHGGQSYRAFEKSIPGDFSSATFFLCAAAITGSELLLLGLDMNDTQGDKAVVDMLAAMGAEIEQQDGGIRIKGGKLTGGEFDLSGTPDALPAMAVTACFAEGETRLVNVAQARLKETDRICAMRRELTEMGAEIEERLDGLVIRGGALKGARVHGHGDHRIVMALAVAGLAAEGRTEIDTAEAMGITFPNFVQLMRSVGATMDSA